MKQIAAYQNEFSGENYRTPEKCLKAEFHYLLKGLQVATRFVVLLPYVDIHARCQELREMIDQLEAKGHEYLALTRTQPLPELKPAEEHSNVIPLKAVNA